jgi:hypothetical protein
VLHRSDRWPAPVRPVTPVRPVDSAGQAGGYSSRTTSVSESLSDFSRPWNKITPKTQPARKENPTQNLTKQFQTDQGLTSSTKTQRHTSQAVHPRQIPQETCNLDTCPPLQRFRTTSSHTGQTGQTHRLDRSGAAAASSSVLRSWLCGSTKEPSGFLVNHRKPRELDVASANRHS